MNIDILAITPVDRNGIFIGISLVLVIIITLKNYGLLKYLKLYKEDLNRDAKVLSAQNAVNALITIDENGIVISWNRRAEIMFGYSEQFMLKKDFSEYIIPPELRHLHKAGIRRYFETGQSKIINNPDGVDLDALYKDGSRFSVRLCLSAGQLKGKLIFCGIIADIRKEKEKERAFLKRINLYKAGEIAGQIGFCKYYIDEDVVVTTTGFNEIFDVEDVPGRKIDFMACVHKDDRYIIENAIAEAIKTGVGYTIEYRVVQRNFKIKLVRCIGDPVLNGEKVIAITYAIIVLKSYD